MMIKLNPDSGYVAEVRKKLKDNDGYCPCRLVKTPETKCICRDFMEAEEGMCDCGLYIKTKD